MEITKIAYGKYEVNKNDNMAKIEFSRHGRYDTFDGKYHPSWLFICNGNSVICASKEQAFAEAEKNL